MLEFGGKCFVGFLCCLCEVLGVVIGIDFLVGCCCECGMRCVALFYIGCVVDG